jgi:integrase
MKRQEALDQFSQWLVSKYRSDKTVKSYCHAVARYLDYLKSNPKFTDLSHSKRVEGYLSWRVQVGDISPSTQGVELNALVQFYRMLGIQLEGVNALRARRRDRIPPILSREQVKILIDNYPDSMRLIPMILYGCGMRINECLRLRLKDVDLVLEKFAIHEAKGDKDRLVPIPKSLLPLVKMQYDNAISQWQDDIHHNFNGVNCGGVEKKYPSYPMSKDWYWLFPAASYSAHPRTHVPMMRHHIMDWSIQRAFEDVRIRCKLPSYTTPHIMRHACLTHMAQDMIAKGFPEKMIKAQLKELSGHVMDETLEGYLHLAAPKNAFVVSPIEGLVHTNYSDRVG